MTQACTLLFLVVIGLSSCDKSGVSTSLGRNDHEIKEGRCVALSSVVYKVRPEHDLDFINLVKMYPVGPAGRLRVSALFTPEIRAEYGLTPGDYYSDDDGRTWRFEGSEPADKSFMLELGTHEADARYKYRVVSAKMDDEGPRWLERSEDGGRSWHRARATVKGYRRPLRYFMLPDGYYHPTDPLSIFVFARELEGFYGDPAVVFRSQDGGESFEIWYIAGAHIPIIAVSPSDPRIIYVSSGCGSLLKSDNSGLSFRPVGMNDEIRSPIVLESEEKGVGFDRPWPEIRQIAVHPERRNLVFAVTEKGVLRSNDGGQTWCVVDLGVENYGTMMNIVFDPRDQRVFYVGTYFGLFISRNDGASWEKIEIFRRVAR